MSFWEWFTPLASAASIVNLTVGVLSIHNGRATRHLNQTTQDWHTEGSPRGHCERSEAISAKVRPRLLRRSAPRNDR